MINWNAIKQAADDWEYGKLGKNIAGFGVKQLTMKPSELDVSRLAGVLDDTERNALIDDNVKKSIDRLQRKRAEFAVRPYSESGWGSMFGPVGYLYASRVNNQPWSDREKLKLDDRYNKFMLKYADKDSEKYREALVNAITKLRSKTAADPLPKAPGVTQLIPNAHPKLIDFYNNQKKPDKIVTGVMSPGMDYSKDRLDPNRRVWQPTATKNLIGGKGATRAEVGHAGIKALQGALSSGYPMWSHDAYRGASGDFPMSKEAMLRRLNMLYRQRDADSAAWCKAMGVPQK